MASSLFSLRAWQSSRTTSLQVLFGLPLGLGPSTSYFMHFFIQSSSFFRSTCPYQRSLYLQYTGTNCTWNIFIASLDPTCSVTPASRRRTDTWSCSFQFPVVAVQQTSANWRSTFAVSSLIDKLNVICVSQLTGDLRDRQVLLTETTTPRNWITISLITFVKNKTDFSSALRWNVLLHNRKYKNSVRKFSAWKVAIARIGPLPVQSEAIRETYNRPMVKKCVIHR